MFNPLTKLVRAVRERGIQGTITQLYLVKFIVNLLERIVFYLTVLFRFPFFGVRLVI